MKNKNKVNFNIKERISIYRIKFINFIRDHKYLSTAIFVFIFAGIIGFIVNALGEDDPFTTLSINPTGVLASNAGTDYYSDGADVLSFDKVTYEINYNLNDSSESLTKEDNISGYVELELSLDSSIDASWIVAENEYTNQRIEIDPVDVNNPKNKLIITQYITYEPNKEYTANATLFLKNIKDGVSIQPEIHIRNMNKENSDVVDIENILSLNVESKPLIVTLRKGSKAEDLNEDSLTEVDDGDIYILGNFNSVEKYSTSSKDDTIYQAFSLDFKIKGQDSIQTEDLLKLNGKYIPNMDFYLSYTQTVNNSTDGTSGTGTINFVEFDSYQEKYNRFFGRIMGNAIKPLLQKSTTFETSYDTSNNEISIENFKYDENSNTTFLSSFIIKLDAYHSENSNVTITLSNGSEQIENNNISLTTEKTFQTIAYSALIQNISTSLDSFENDLNDTTAAKSGFFAVGDELYLENRFIMASQAPKMPVTIIIDLYDTTDTATNNNVFFDIRKDDNIEDLIYYKTDSLDKTVEKKPEISFLICEKSSCNDTTTTVTKNSGESNNDFYDRITNSFGEGKEYEGYIIKSIFITEELDTSDILDVAIPVTINSNVMNDKVTYVTRYKFADSNGENEKVLPEYPTKQVYYELTISPFKATSDIFVDGRNEDLYVEISSIDKNTLSIYPNISVPIDLYNTNALNLGDVSADLTITLPKGINYLENDMYIQPIDIEEKESGTILKYKLENIPINDWINPINIDINYDNNLDSNKELKITSLISASSTKGYEDNSSEDDRTSVRTITYINEKEIFGKLESDYSLVSANSPFNVKANIYNRGNSEKNVDYILVLPKNDYDGSYTLANTEGTDYNSLLDNSSCLVGVYDLETAKATDDWQPCSNYKDDGYSEVSAIKLNIQNFNNTLLTYDFKVIPQDNKADNTYLFESIIIDKTSYKEKTVEDLIIKVADQKITGNVWLDFNENGMMDDDEDRLSDIKLYLYDENYDCVTNSSGQCVYTYSNLKGSYTFPDVEENKSYYVVAEYNSLKYLLAGTRADVTDLKYISSFELIEDSSIVDKINSNNNNDMSFDEKELEDKETDEDLYNEGIGDGDEPIIDGDPDTGEEQENIQPNYAISKLITIDKNNKIVSNINLGLRLQKFYDVKVSKFINKAIVTNNFGVSTVNDYGNAKLAKLDVKDMNNLTIKVIYTIVVENVGSYPGYVYSVKDYIPDGMSFNSAYEENNGWSILNESVVENKSVSDKLLYSGDKIYLNVAFDITRKEAGSFVNQALIDSNDLMIFGGNRNE